MISLKKTVRHIKKIQLLLYEYTFDWNFIKSKSVSLTNDFKSTYSYIEILQ
jgi:hypothetical protein